MAIGQEGTAALLLAAPGVLAFLFGVIAENKKPSDLSTPSAVRYDPVDDQSICHYGSDPTIALGIAAVVFLFITTILALIALCYPYNGKRVPLLILWRQSTCLVVFTVLGLLVVLVAKGLFVWDVSSEIHHRTHNVHDGRIAECPTAKTGLFGGAGFLALDATLFFLIALLLTNTARSDYLEPNDEEDDKGPYEEIVTLQQSEHADTGVHTQETA